MNQNKVPADWNKTYFSMKGLSNWIEDLVCRYQFFSTWAHKGVPYVFSLSYFTFPTGFTTSLLQKYSRKAGSQSIDRLEFDFITMTRPVADISEHPKDGAFIHGLYLEGAKWHEDDQCLCEPEVMELTVEMPVIHFKPISKRTKALQQVYECPCYYYPQRQGTVYADSYQLSIILRLGAESAEHWIKRGTAILMSLAT